MMPEIHDNKATQNMHEEGEGFISLETLLASLAFIGGWLAKWVKGLKQESMCAKQLLFARQKFSVLKVASLYS